MIDLGIPKHNATGHSAENQRSPDSVIPAQSTPRRPQPPPKRVKNASIQDWGPPIQKQNAESWRFFWHEEILKRWDLARSEIAVAGVLMHEDRTDKGFAEIGLERLARMAGCSRSTAFKAIQTLRRKGLIVVANEGQRKPDGSLPTSRYRLTYKSRGVP